MLVQHGARPGARENMKHHYRELVWSSVLMVAVGCSGNEAAPPKGPGTGVAPVGTVAGNPGVSGTGTAGVLAPTAGSGLGVAAAGRSAAGTGAPAVGAPGVAGVAAPLPAGTGAGGALVAGNGGAIVGGAGGAVTASGSGTAAISGSGGMVAAGGVAAAPDSPAQSLPPITDYTKAGPFKTVTEPNKGPGNNYTIYRPDPLGADGFKHSPIIFGPGIITSCEPGNILNIYADLLNHFSSHGFVTICVNSLGGGPNDPNNLTAMQMGLDWLVAQNAEAGVFQGKLAVDRGITMGYSIGATASTQLSSHKAIMTTVSIHGHGTKGDPHGPIWLMTGTDDVIDQNRMTLMTLEEAPAVMTALPIGHLDVPAEIAARGRYVGPITAWLRYWVNGDQGAKHFFFGADCDTCKSPWIPPESNEKWKAQM